MVKMKVKGSFVSSEEGGEARALLGGGSSSSGGLCSDERNAYQVDEVIMAPQSYSSLAYSSDNDDDHCNSIITTTTLPSHTSILHNDTFAVLMFSIASLAMAFTIHHHSMNNNITSVRLQATHNNHQAYFNEETSNEEEVSLKARYSSSLYKYNKITNEPLSYKSPQELGIPVYNNRPQFSRPESVFGSVQNGSQVGVPLPTNEWYLNLLVGLNEDPGPNDMYENYAGEANRVHTIPYIVDVVGPVVGIRLHYPNVLSYGTVVQSNFIPYHGLTLGTSDDGFTRRYRVDEDTLPSKLGIALRWGEEKHYMRSRILRGIPYGTMEYDQGVLPTIASEIVSKLPIIDGLTQLECGTLDPLSKDGVSTNAASVLVEEDVELHFPESDLTWLVFFSRPIHVQCYMNPNKLTRAISVPPGGDGGGASNDNPNAFQLRVDPTSLDIDEEPLIVRIAVGNNCTSGTNVNFCNQNQARDQSTFMSVLREHAEVYPTSPTVKYEFADPEGGLKPDTPDSKSASLYFDWNARSFGGKSDKELLMFALPHHVDIMDSNEVVGHCFRSLHGNACLVKGSLWTMEETLGGLPNFSAPRPPNHLAIPALAMSLSQDIMYSLPDNYMRGSGDTYFSGKMLAKLGRVIVIGQELRGLAATAESELPDSSTPDGEELLSTIRACKEATLPTEKEVTDAIARLRSGVEVWLNGTAEAPFTYDNSWG